MAETKNNKDAMTNICTVVASTVLLCLVSAGASAETEAELQQLRLAIDVAIGQPRATSVGQCRVIALGAKPCGGPREYLVYSAEATEDQTLRDLVKQYNRCEQQRNDRLGLMSDCAFVEQPRLILKQGRCLAR